MTYTVKVWHGSEYEPEILRFEDNQYAALACFLKYSQDEYSNCRAILLCNNSPVFDSSKED